MRIMNEIPAALKEYLRRCLLGRLRLKLLEKISCRKGYFPYNSEITRYLLELSRLNADIATMFVSILNMKYTEKLNLTDLKESSDTNSMLYELEEKPIGGPIFIELVLGSELALGAWVTCYPLLDSGFVYSITLLAEEYFPDSVIGYVEIRASKLNPNPVFSVLSTGKDNPKNYYKCYDLSNYTDCSIIVIALKILNYVSNIQNKKFINIAQLNNSKEHPKLGQFIPPVDPVYYEFVRKVLDGKMCCTQIEAPLEAIHPYDLDFCIKFPLDVVKECMNDIQSGVESHLLTYWRNNTFVMSDDYPVYLAYRALKYKEILIVVMGDFPDGNYKVIKRGGYELLPPARTSNKFNYNSLKQEIKEILLDERLDTMSESQGISKLYDIFLGLAALVQDPSTQEKQLHQFILSNPISLDSYGISIHSEIKLGEKYKVDLIIEYKINNKRILLVELEKANLQLFTKSGRLRAHVTHAIQQVEDWLRWWQENSNAESNKLLDTSIHPEGLVVIGRGKDLSEEDSRRLLHLNSNRRVKVITYDDLLDNLENLILNLEKDRAK